MGSLVERQQRHFTDRIRRIEAGGPNTSGTIYAGLDEQHHRRRRRRRKQGQGGSLLAQFLMVPFAMALGAAVMLVGRVGTYHALAAPELIPAETVHLFTLTADIGIATALALFAVPLFGLGRGARLTAFMIGFIAVMLGEATIISQVPGPFASMFSDEYVQTAIARAPADPFSPEALGL